MVDPKQKPKEKELTEEEKMDLVEQNLADLDDYMEENGVYLRQKKTAYPKFKGIRCFLFFHTAFEQIDFN